MTIISVDTDDDDLSVTVTAHFTARVERVWRLWADRGRLERWWGPPSFPASFRAYDLVAGARVRYRMTGPQGEPHWGMWRVTAVDPPTALEFDDVITDAEGEPAAGLPVTRVRVRLAERDGGTRMTMRSEFASRGDLESWLSTGTREGQEAAVAQMDELLRP